jgi:hypothetical protein
VFKLLAGRGMNAPMHHFKKLDVWLLAMIVA